MLSVLYLRYQLSKRMRFWYYSHFVATNAQRSLCKCADPPESSLLAYIKDRCQWRFNSEFRPQAKLHVSMGAHYTSQSTIFQPFLSFWVEPGPEVINFFQCSIQLSMKLILLINVKMPTIVGILTFISMIKQHLRGLKQETSSYDGTLIFMSSWNFMLRWVEHEKVL